MNEKFEQGDFRIKLYEKTGFWHLDFLFKGETFMGFLNREYSIMKDDFETAKCFLK